jgi:cytochrome c-type biogenesis protein CcmH
MLFWSLAILAALGVAAVLGRALMRGEVEPGAELAVYRDQLDEVERDRSRGVLTDDEAGRLRAEVARRLLAADRAAQTAGSASGGPGRWAAGILAASVVALSLGIYASLGSPRLPDRGLAGRLAEAEEMRAARPSQAEAEERWGRAWQPPPDAEASYLDLVERLRAAVRERPDDATGLGLLVTHEQALGNYSGAHRALIPLLALKGDAATADEWSQAATLMIVAAGGFVSAEAEQALTEALERDPRRPAARYYSGLLFAQTGRPDLAFRMWRPLLEESPPDSPWVAPIRADIEAVAAAAGISYSLPPQRGPTAADIAAAGEMDEAARAEMIRGMVDGLAERLATEGGPASDWARLIGALGVLGETERATTILAEAREVFAADPAGLAEIEAAGRQAGLP